MATKVSLSKYSSVLPKDYQTVLDSRFCTRAVGGSPAVEVGNIYELHRIDKRSSYMMPNDFESAKDDDARNALWNSYDDAKRAEICNGRLTEWLVFETNMGDLSFSAVMGSPRAVWTNSKKHSRYNELTAFVASSRTIKDWVEFGCDGLLEAIYLASKENTDVTGQYPTLTCIETSEHNGRKYRRFCLGSVENVPVEPEAPVEEQQG